MDDLIIWLDPVITAKNKKWDLDSGLSRNTSNISHLRLFLTLTLYTLCCGQSNIGQWIQAHCARQDWSFPIGNIYSVPCAGIKMMVQVYIYLQLICLKQPHLVYWPQVSAFIQEELRGYLRLIGIKCSTFIQIVYDYYLDQIMKLQLYKLFNHYWLTFDPKIYQTFNQSKYLCPL